MKIVTSLRVKEELQRELKAKYKMDEIYFFPTINEAKKDLNDAEILLTYGEDLTSDLINRAKYLKWIMVMSAGVDKLPFEDIKNKGILVTNVRGIHKIPMAEFTLGMMLQVTKQFKPLATEESNARWNRSLMASELYGKTVLIIGVGAIGGQIAKLCKVFGMTIHGVNRSGKKVEYVDEIGTIDQLRGFLPKADFVISVLPSTPETKYLLNQEHFQLMKDTSVFINIGRGDVVKDSVIVEVMKERQIAHAVLDVFEQEPLPSDHLFWKMDNVTVTPHVSSKTANYLPRAFEIFEKNLHIYKSNETNFINEINVERGY